MAFRAPARAFVVVSSRARAALSVAALLTALSGCGKSNVQACTEYVDKVNAEYTACGVTPLIDTTNTCPTYLDRGGADCSEYYACLAEEIECRDGTIVHRGEIADGGPDDRRCSGCL
jgi:hypothetical protein